MAIKLHYGGETFSLPDKHAGLLDDYNGEPGTIKVNLGDGKWLQLAVGPGIPVLIESVKPGHVRGLR